MNTISRIKRTLYCRQELWLELKKYIDLLAFRKDWIKNADLESIKDLRKDQYFMTNDITHKNVQMVMEWFKHD